MYLRNTETKMRSRSFGILIGAEDDRWLVAAASLGWSLLLSVSLVHSYYSSAVWVKLKIENRIVICSSLDICETVRYSQFVAILHDLFTLGVFTLLTGKCLAICLLLICCCNCLLLLAAVLFLYIVIPFFLSGSHTSLHCICLPIPVRVTSFKFDYVNPTRCTELLYEVVSVGLWIMIKKWWVYYPISGGSLMGFLFCLCICILQFILLEPVFYLNAPNLHQRHYYMCVKCEFVCVWVCGLDAVN